MLTVILSFLSFCGFIFLHQVWVARAVDVAVMVMVGAMGAPLRRRLLQGFLDSLPTEVFGNDLRLLNGLSDRSGVAPELG